MFRAVLYGAAALLTFCIAPLSVAADDRDACASGEKEAIAACSRLIQHNPKDAFAYSGRAVAYDSEGDYDRAIADVDQVIRLDPKQATIYLVRGLIYLAKRDYSRAIADFDQAIKLKYLDAYIIRGAVYLAKGDYDRVIADLKDSNNSGAYSVRGAAYAMKGEYDRAIAYLDKAIPDLDQAWHAMQSTDRKFVSILTHSGYFHSASAYSHRGYAYGKKGDFDRAMTDLDKAVALNPKYARGYGLRAAIHELRGDATHAIEDASEATRLDPKDAFAYNVRGKAYFDKRDYALAVVNFDEAIRLDPTLQEARHNRDRAQAVLFVPQTKPQTVPTAELQATSSVPAERRVALVIGNSAYRSSVAPVLSNPRRDAKLVAGALRQAGFETVELMDLDLASMVKALQAFRGKADSADWALVYFAGHGIGINGTNYLLPVDVKLSDSRDVELEAVSYEAMLKAIEGAKALRIIILDACRDNPFKANWRQTLALRGSLDRGLVPPPETVPGTMVVYSAREGQAAVDGDGVNSPFALAFVARLKAPGREVRRMFDEVRDDVLEATRQRQQPYTYGSLPGSRDFYFVAGK